MRHGSTPENGVPGRRCRLPEIPKPYSADQDPIQRLLAFAYAQAQRTHREAEAELQKDADILSAVLAAQSEMAFAQFDLEQSLEFIAEGARRLTGAGGAAIALRDGQKVVCRGRSGLLAPELGACLNPHSGVCGECLTSGEVQLCEDTEHDRRVDIWVCRNLGIRSILAVPLRRQQDVLGIIVAFSGWAGVFGERDARSLKLLAGLVIEALWSHEVHQRPALAPELAPKPAVPAPAAEPISDTPLQVSDVANSPVPEPVVPPTPADPNRVCTSPGRESQEVPAPLDAPAATATELPVPLFAVLGSAEPRRLGRIVTIIVAGLAVLAGGTEAVLWRGAHVRKLLHFRQAAVAPRAGATSPATVSSAPETPKPVAAAAEPVVNAVPGVSSGFLAVSGPSQLLSIRSLSKPEGTTIALFLQAPARWASGRLKDPERIYFDLENTQLAAEMLTQSREGLAIPVNNELVSRIRVSPRETSAVRVVIELAAPAEYSAVLSATEPYRLMIVVRRAVAPPSSPPNPEPAPLKKIPSSQTDTLAPHAALSRHPKIVIDPGHGGTEDGAIGHGGLKEKDLVLEISKRLGDLLANRLGAEVIYTRSSDLTVPLEARAAIANQAGADLFISIHANSSDDPNARGVETYYVAGSPSPVADDHKLSESHKFAVDIQQALYHAVGGEKGVLNRGVKQAPFVVLLDADMPSILAEVAFVTSPADEHRLGTAEGQDALADALYRGIAHYLSMAGRGKAVASLGGQQGN